MPKRTLAARAGHWSARHRKTAVFGWLAFVVIAFAIGNVIGTRTLADEDTGNGSSRAADPAISRANFPKRAAETGLIPTRGQLRVRAPGLRRAVGDGGARLARTPPVVDLKSPYAPGNRDQLAKDGRSA